MRNAKRISVLIPVVFICVGCMKHLDANDIDMVIAKESLDYLHRLCEMDSSRVAQVEGYNLPIGQKYSYCGSNGVYIQFGSFFVEENGLFSPYSGVEIIESPGTDPSYKLLSDKVYSYVVKG